MSNSTIYTGTTNTDGTGSSANLNAENASNQLIDEVFSGNNLNGESEIVNAGSITSLTASSWNAAGQKEAKIDNDSRFVSVNDFVDVDITNTNSDGAHINVLNAKRGSITTDDGDDQINLSVYSNNNHWVNHFDVDTGAGNDDVTMYDSLNSENTAFDIALGDGNDSLDVSGLLDPIGSAVGHRNADGGEGIDTLRLSGQDTVSFENFEVVIGADHNFGTGITVDSDLLADNGSADHNLIFSNVDISLGDHVTTDSVNDLSEAQQVYLTSELGHVDANDYVSVTLTGDDDHVYTIITDDADYSALA